MTFPRTLTDLSKRDLLIISAALSVVSPSGGGSDPHTVLLKIRQQNPDIDPLETDTLEMEFCGNVIEEAREAGVVAKTRNTNIEDLYKLCDGFVAQGILEDRRKYDIEDFMSTYNLCRDDAQVLRQIVLHCPNPQ